MSSKIDISGLPKRIPRKQKKALKKKWGYPKPSQQLRGWMRKRGKKTQSVEFPQGLPVKVTYGNEFTNCESATETKIDMEKVYDKMDDMLSEGEKKNNG